MTNVKMAPDRRSDQGLCQNDCEQGAVDLDQDDSAISFSGYVLSRRPLRLSRDGTPVEVPRQSLELLDYLIVHRGRVATRDELIERFWALDQVSADQSLNSCVRRLRRALGESGGDSELIETHPRVGYRFVGNVSPQQIARAMPLWRRPAFVSLAALALIGALVLTQQAQLIPAWRATNAGASLRAHKMPIAIAIPPGRNMCETTIFPMFLEGLRENLIADIYRWPGNDIALLRVDSRDDAEGHGEAQYYLDLGVRQMPDRTIANLALISTATGEISWATQLDEPTDVGNYLSTQETIAARLAEEFALREDRGQIP